MTVRSRILDYLESKAPSSSGDLARVLHMPAANVRHHLRALMADGVIEVVARQSGPSRGRPSRLYDLVEKTRSHNLDRLADVLLASLIEHLPPEGRQQAIQEIAGRLVMERRSTRQVSLAQRLSQAVQRLNELNYRAHWEAHSQAPRIVLGHCPYAAILEDHPELCSMDASLIEHLAGAPAQQVKKLAQDSRGSRYCLFVAG